MFTPADSMETFAKYLMEAYLEDRKKPHLNDTSPIVWGEWKGFVLALGYETGANVTALNDAIHNLRLTPWDADLRPLKNL
jgi:hypothetical protein